MSILFQQNVRANYPSERPAYEGVDYAGRGRHRALAAVAALVALNVD